MNDNKRFDLLVVGTGVAASSIASRCAKADWKVGIIDERPFGGTCQLRGCDPKKVLRRGAEVIEAARLMQGKGIDHSDALRIDWPTLVAFKRSFTDPVPESKEKSFEHSGIATFHGRAIFVDERMLEVDGQRLHAGRIALANGARPRPLPIDGAEYLIHSDRFMELEDLPRRLVFAGGGYVTFEFAHLAARAGADVTILEMSERALGPFDADLVAQLVERGRAVGINLRSNAKVERIGKSGNGFTVSATIDGQGETLEADGIVHGAGRVPATDGLELERGGVRYGKRGIEVNEYLQSVSNPAVYAAGDVAATDGLPLTPVAGLEGDAVATNLLNGNAKTVDYRGVPSCVFTIPPLAAVGLTEKQAKEQGIDYDCRYSDMSDWYLVRRVGETHAAAKVLVAKRDGRILGAHLLGPECEQMINFFGIAIRRGWTCSDLGGIVSAYPSTASYVASLI
ncbi:MAG TPA: NAD(P)/FAD-dependent oxidoreductase [Gammaproteobacteria bacterium]|nr:NAD(P)/FAD-dependent oxidoreductase [Gammaproteobacteria bacterium]